MPALPVWLSNAPSGLGMNAALVRDAPLAPPVDLALREVEDLLEELP